MTDDDAVLRLEKLLRLAASDNENEAANAARAAARHLRSAEGRVVVTSAAEAEARRRCVLCQPALAFGRCDACGHVGPGPGHLCLSRKAADLCEAHRTWPLPLTAYGRPAVGLGHLPDPADLFPPVPMWAGPPMSPPLTPAAWSEIEALRAALRDVEQERDALRAENAALREKAARPRRPRRRKTKALPAKVEGKGVG